jgi:hypothetical protein
MEGNVGCGALVPAKHIWLNYQPGGGLLADWPKST